MIVTEAHESSLNIIKIHRYTGCIKIHGSIYNKYTVDNFRFPLLSSSQPTLKDFADGNFVCKFFTFL
jgi:hypothetical protein